MGGGRDGLGVWDGNDIKLGCDDRCTTINVVKKKFFLKKAEHGTGFRGQMGNFILGVLSVRCFLKFDLQRPLTF